MAGRLQGKAALITGAGSGIGQASAILFADEGAKVVVNDINAEGVEATVKAITNAGGEAVGEVADISNSENVTRVVDGLVERWGQIDVLMNCAFYMTISNVGDLDDEQWHSNFTVTLDGTFYTMRAALMHMKTQGSGAIVNVSSGGGIRQITTLGPYCAAKRAVLSLTETVAIENARYGIRANSLCPGPIGTPALLAFVDQLPNQPDGSSGRKAYADQLPMGRMGEPVEMANVALFLASDEASYITGSTFVADGGTCVVSATPRY